MIAPLELLRPGGSVMAVRSWLSAVVGVLVIGAAACSGTDAYDASVLSTRTPRMEADEVAAIARDQLEAAAENHPYLAVDVAVDIVSVVATNFADFPSHVEGIDEVGGDGDPERVVWVVEAKGPFILERKPPPGVGSAAPGVANHGWLVIDDADGSVIALSSSGSATVTPPIAPVEQSAAPSAYGSMPAGVCGLTSIYETLESQGDTAEQALATFLSGLALQQPRDERDITLRAALLAAGEAVVASERRQGRVVYDARSGATLNGRFEVQARPDGGWEVSTTWVPLPEDFCSADARQ